MVDKGTRNLRPVGLRDQREGPHLRLRKEGWVSVEPSPSFEVTRLGR